jgi:hypothetical protein
MSHRPDDVGSTDFWNAGKLAPFYTALQPRMQPPSAYISLQLVPCTANIGKINIK